MRRYYTLYVIIDENHKPPESIRRFCDIIDCCEINKFCSIFGDAVVGNLADSEGVPLYRFLSPLANLLNGFKKSNKNAYYQIIKQWYSILADMLNRFNKDDSDIYLNLPEEYTDWLINHENEYLNQVGFHLLNSNNKVKLDRTEIYESVVLNSICESIEKQLKNISYDLIVFSNPVIIDNCDIILNNAINLKNTHYITTSQLVHWESLIIENYNILKETLKYDKFYILYKSQIESAITGSFKEISHHIIKMILETYNPRVILSDLFEANRDSLNRELYKITLALFDSFDDIIEEYRFLYEYQQYFKTEKLICEALGLEFNSEETNNVINHMKETRVMPPEIPIIISNFARIIIRGSRVTDMIILFQNKGNLNNNSWVLPELQNYYRYYCLEKLKLRIDMLIRRYEPVKKESKGTKLCFLTTAMCTYYNKDDNCYELTFLRGFRDFWLKFNDDGEKIIQQYYEIAPIILSKINCDIQCDAIFEYIKNCIYLCIQFINSKNYIKAKNNYIRMVNNLLNHYCLYKNTQ